MGFPTRGGSRISGKGVHMYKGVGFAMLILSHFSLISHANEKKIGLTDQTGGGGGVFKRTPEPHLWPATVD